MTPLLLHIICFICGAASTLIIARTYIRRHLQHYDLMPVLPIAAELNELAHCLNRHNRIGDFHALHQDTRTVHGKLLRLVKQYYRIKTH